MIRNVRATEVTTEFDVAWALMNAIDNDAYDLVKNHLGEMKDLTLPYTVERMKAVEMKLKDASNHVTGQHTKASQKMEREGKTGYAITARTQAT